MYRFKETARLSKQTQEMASVAQQSAAQASQSAAQASQGLSDKVGKMDDAQIITMINRATEIIHLIGKRLKVETDNFTLTEDGKVTMSDATIKSTKGEYEIPVSTEIKEGTIILEPDYKIQAEGEQILFDLLHFKFGSTTYILRMLTHWAEGSTTESDLRLVFDQFFIAEAE
jgi:hypothetical protein